MATAHMNVLQRVGHLVALVAVASAVGGCVNKETPARAIYVLAHEAEHSQVEPACDRAYPVERLPASAARVLGLPAARSGAAAEQQLEAECVRSLRAGGRLEALEFEEPYVDSVREIAVTGGGPIRRAATASVRFGATSPRQRTVKLVLVGSRWRVLLAGSWSRVA